MEEYIWYLILNLELLIFQECTFESEKPDCEKGFIVKTCKNCVLAAGFCTGKYFPNLVNFQK